jgi:hypothetical protein
VKSLFDTTKYLWVEKWIHLLVHVFPVGSAIYLLTIQAFNPTGFGGCWVASIPFGCGDENQDGIECERGPQNIEQIVWLFNGLPTFFVLLFPACVMLTLFCQVCHTQNKAKKQQSSQSGNRRKEAVSFRATDVAKQAGFYLLIMYWSYLFAVINKGFVEMADTTIFPLVLLSTINLGLQGVWFYLVYRHFAVFRTNKQWCHPCKLPCQKAPMSRGKQMEHKDFEPEQDGDWTFNIFDGTNADGAFAAFIYEGESDDERDDKRESVHWSELQNHI